MRSDWRAELRRLDDLRDTAQWPAHARDTLLGVFLEVDATDGELRRAATLLCLVPGSDDSWVEDLLALAANGGIPEQDRVRAATTLGPVLEIAYWEGFDAGNAPVTEALYDSIRIVLHGLYADSKVPIRLRRRALESLAYAPDGRLDTAIRTAYAADLDWRITALRCMYFQDGFEDEILQSLSSTNPDILGPAIRAAAICGITLAWPYAHAALIKPEQASKPLLLAAIYACGQIGTEDAEDLLEGLVSSDDADIARDARHTLAFIRWPLLNYDFGEGPRPN